MTARVADDERTERTTEVHQVVEPPRSPVAMAAKRVTQALAFVVVLPRLAIYGAASLVLGKARAFANASEGVGRVPGLRGLFLRQAFYRATLESCGRDVYFGWLCAFSTPAARVGEGAYIGRRCGLGLVSIGQHVMIADGVQVLSGARQHGTELGSAFREQAQEYRHVAIGEGAWIGADAVVMADVGERSVVAAGAVVIRDVEPKSVVAGVPAKTVRKLGPQGVTTA